MEDAVDQENAEKSVDTYDKFVGTEVCLPDEKGRKNDGHSHQECEGQQV